ncbi:unnamed protein product [Periconia digitata]|uniref:Yippee domain-containing protein n=1 Tax=Periconia digitata TaxID=1303443 RepID=A0A9W4UGJ4_9PLEO|nr:unnamed protein product [Periconia digitata]
MTNLTFPLYLIPSIPFRRRRRTSSTTTLSTTPTSTPSSSPPTHPPTYLSPPTSPSYLRCSKCLSDLIPTTSIISKGFTGRHGRAYLVTPPTSSTLYHRSADLDNMLPPSELPNTKVHKAVPRQLVTGAHTVSDISCRSCGTVLGWKYVDAVEESQKYKVGKFILETKRVVRGVSWEDAAEDGTGEEEYVGGGDGERRKAGDDEIEFDSQDEDECEDLFAGVWSAKVAERRRKRGGNWV